MKKKLLFLVIFSIYFCIAELIFNIVMSDAASTQSASDDQVKDQLIENIASRVAELKLVEKRGIIGVVTDVSNTQISISDVQNKTRFIDVDELTKFASPSAKGSFGISDITKGTTIGALGLYNKESRRLLARFVNAITLPKFIFTKVDTIDTKNIMLNTTTEDKKSLIVDIQTSTKISLHNKEAGLTRSSFSKINVNDEIIVIGLTLATNENMIAASRLIVLTDFRPNETTIPSTGSAKSEKLRN